jgi:hypothetical protein
MAEFTKFQKKVIQNYYDNREGIALQRVSELVTELYLTTGKSGTNTGRAWFCT